VNHFSSGYCSSWKGERPLSSVMRCVAFVLTGTKSISQISLLQFRDDSRMKSESIDEPSKEMKSRYPVFFFRVSLARLVNEFSRAKGPEHRQSSTSFYSCLQDLSDGITTLKTSVPLEWRPDHEIYADPTKHPSVFAFHLEYHMLQMQIFTSRKAYAKLATTQEISPKTASETESIEDDNITSYMTSARRIFQIIGGIRASPRLNTTMKWL
jgi:hypothetical protein